MSAWPENILLASSHSDPYPFYRSLAEQGWHYDASLGIWLAASHRAVRAVLDSPACRVRPLAQPVPPAIAGSILGQTFGRWLRMRDGAAHAGLRRAVMASLAGLPLQEAEASAAALAGRFLSEGELSGRRIDGLIDFLPVAALAAALGWPVAGLSAAAERIALVCRALAADADEAAREQGAAACQSLLDELAALPGEGWLRRWREAFMDLDETALAANLLGALFQSRDAGAGLLSAAIAWRGEAPWDWRDEGQWSQRLRADPVLHHTRRFVAEDVELAGQRLKAGDQVLVLLAAAAQDPAGPGEAMDFGRGRHACPGEGLALAIARGALRALEEAGADWSALLKQMVFLPIPNARIRRFGEGSAR
ncbi:hypothetical protein [Chromobacterium sp. IIBBL 290-4]|uniref:hypothetical protein n=1 Tax=Chromobacterium sp. IIBBL 290-4 TaxID=2953890 RepID=UPI0020B74F85|nr:hypothetical protein [Chromobacterium sp. IIBBL 290-4]UTH76145.1 hypothetical protein NKT35_08585 [Chromobacterium sp. IIBBL 290-4]